MTSCFLFRLRRRLFTASSLPARCTNRFARSDRKDFKLVLHNVFHWVLKNIYAYCMHICSKCRVYLLIFFPFSVTVKLLCNSILKNKSFFSFLCLFTHFAVKNSVLLMNKWALVYNTNANVKLCWLIYISKFMHTYSMKLASSSQPTRTSKWAME